MKKFLDDIRVQECIIKAFAAGGWKAEARAKDMAKEYQSKIDAGEIIIFEDDADLFAMEGPAIKKCPSEEEILTKAIDEYTRFVNHMSDSCVLSRITDDEVKAITNALSAIHSSAWINDNFGLKLPSGYMITGEGDFRHMVELTRMAKSGK